MPSRIRPPKRTHRSGAAAHTTAPTRNRADAARITGRRPTRSAAWPADFIIIIIRLRTLKYRIFFLKNNICSDLLMRTNPARFIDMISGCCFTLRINYVLKYNRILITFKLIFFLIEVINHKI